jgi:predicted  nucleic acid-binding Zn-ribbon protein
MSEQIVTLEFIKEEIASAMKQIEEKESYIKHLQAELENANNDRNAIFGALQQCEKIKKMLIPPTKKGVPNA